MRITKKLNLNRNRISDLRPERADIDMNDRCLYDVLDRDEDTIDLFPDIWHQSHYHRSREEHLIPAISFWSGVAPVSSQNLTWLSNETVVERLREIVRVEAERLLNQRLPAIRDEIRREIGIFDEPSDGAERTADPVAEWCHQHRAELREFPSSYVAIDLVTDSIVFAEADEWAFARRLREEESEAGRKFAFVFTGVLPHLSLDAVV